MGFFMEGTPGERCLELGGRDLPLARRRRGCPGLPSSSTPMVRGGPRGVNNSYICYMIYEKQAHPEDSVRPTSTRTSPSPARHARAARPLAFRPLYLQIKDLLVERLDAGHWRP